MNTPNKLTLLRIIMVPFFMAFLLWTDCPHNYLIAGLLFGAAAITDCIDGKLARKHNQITDFGKFMDPIADKLLVCGALVAMVELGLCSSWVVIVVLLREFLVQSLRLMAAAGDGKVIAANMWGKVKTVTQMIAIIAVMAFQEGVYIGLFPDGNLMTLLGEILLWISAAATLISGVVYLKQNINFVKNTK